MKSTPCPKCGATLNVTGLAPGSAITCPACGNVTVAPKSNRKLFIIIGTIAGVVLLCPCVGGILAAIAVPNTLRFQARAKQGECKANLKAWYTAQRAYHAEHDAYSATPSVVGFSPEQGNRYAYFAGPGSFEDRAAPQAGEGEPATGIGVDTARHRGNKELTFAQLPEDVAARVGLSGECPDCEITLACAGQIDNDETLDVWTISTADREAGDGSSIPKGSPFQHVDDVMN